MKSRLALLLLGWLVAAAAWAQPGPSSGATVDTRAECLVLAGTWKPAADEWRAACEVPWSRGDCLRLGGSWTQVAKAATGGRCLAPVSEWATALQCMDRGGNFAPGGSRPPSCTFVATRVPGRVPPAVPTDTGKPCDNQKDCLYGCVYQGPEMPPGAGVPGRCRAAKVAGGCFSMVEGGRLAGSICVK